MEFDDLKQIWKQDLFQRKGEEEIAAMIKGKSKSIISKLKRSAWMELIFTIVAGFVLLYFSFTMPNGALKWYFISFLILFIGYIVYYVKKINLLNRFDIGQENIKASIETLINDLTTYLKFYKNSYTLLYPVYFLLMFLFVAMERGMDEFIHALSQPRTLVYLIFLASLFIACSLWFTKWYLKKLYGNHLEKLQALLKDLSE